MSCSFRWFEVKAQWWGFDDLFFFFSFFFLSSHHDSCWHAKIKDVLSFYLLYQIWFSFFLLLFVLFWIYFELICFKISSLNSWFHLIFISNLVLILLVATFFNPFFNWLFFNFIPQHLTSFYFYIKFGPHFYNCYLFCFRWFFDWFFFNFII